MKVLETVSRASKASFGAERKNQRRNEKSQEIDGKMGEGGELINDL